MLYHTAKNMANNQEKPVDHIYIGGFWEHSIYNFNFIVNSKLFNTDDSIHLLYQPIGTIDNG